MREAFAYSSLVRLADGRIALLYEARGHRDLELLRFPLKWLTGEWPTGFQSGPGLPKQEAADD